MCWVLTSESRHDNRKDIWPQNCTSYPSWNVLSLHSSSFTAVPSPVWEGHGGMVLKRMYRERVNGNWLAQVHLQGLALNQCVCVCVCVRVCVEWTLNSTHSLTHWYSNNQRTHWEVLQSFCQWGRDSWRECWQEHIVHRQSDSHTSQSLYTTTTVTMCNNYIYTVAQKNVAIGPSYLIANILKTQWPNSVETGELLQYYMLNTVINVLFKNFIALWCHLVKTQLLLFIHIVQIDLSITQ